MRAIPLLLILVCLPSCGGGPSRGAVEGTILLANGLPLAEGIIRFVPVNGTTQDIVFARIQQGKYHLPADKGPRVGKYQVLLFADRPTGEQVELPDGPRGVFVPKVDQFLPARYNLESRFIMEIQEGTNDFSLKLDVE